MYKLKFVIFIEKINFNLIFTTILFKKNVEYDFL